MIHEITQSRRIAYIAESEALDRELLWVGLLCDWIGKLESVEHLPDMITGAGEYIRRYARRRVATEAYFWGRSPGDFEDDAEVRAEWARLQILHPGVPSHQAVTLPAFSGHKSEPLQGDSSPFQPGPK